MQYYSENRKNLKRHTLELVHCIFLSKIDRLVTQIPENEAPTIPVNADLLQVFINCTIKPEKIRNILKQIPLDISW